MNKQLFFITLFSIFAPFSALATNSSLEIAKSCLPPTSGRYLIERHEIVASVVDEGNEYFLINSVSKIVQKGQKEHNIPHVLKISQNSCDVVFANPMGDFVSLSNFIPQDVARKLTLNSMVQQVNELGSTEAFLERFYTATRDSEQVVLTDEEFWALKQLGYETPSHQKVVLTP